MKYYGGLREDLEKNIYFFPANLYLSKFPGYYFPADTSECLLYTFNNLEVGMFLPINQGNITIQVVEIDSLLLGNSYHKRYKIWQSDLIGPDYWIEGIGSAKDLLSPYTREFEWAFYTLCFTDSITYFINSPNGEDSCHYYLPAVVNEPETPVKLTISPVPNDGHFTVTLTNENNRLVSISVINSLGILVYESGEFAGSEKIERTIDLGQVPDGIYSLILWNGTEKVARKIVICH